MARRLELDVVGDSKDAGRALDKASRNVDELRRSTDRLNKEFVAAGRTSGTFDRQAERLGDTMAKDAVKARLLARALDDVGDEARRAGREFDRMSAKRKLPSLPGAAAGAAEGLNFQALPINPQTAVAGAAAGAAAAPLVGGAVGGAIIGAGALAGVGLGVAGAVKGNKAVGDAWVVEATRVKDAWLEASQAFAGPTVAAAGEFRKAMESIDLDEILGDASKFVAPLAAGVANAITYLGDGFEDLVDNAGPVVAELGHGISETGKAIGTALSDISGEADGGAKALRDLFKIINGFIVGTGRFIGFFEDAYGKLKIFQTGINDAYRAVADNSVGPIHAAAELGAALSGTGLEADAFGRAIEGAGVKTDDFGRVAGDAFYGLDQKARDATDTMARLNTEFQKAVNNALGLSNASIALEQDWDDLAEGFKRGAGALDLNTQKGRDNQRLINDTIADLERRRQAEIDAGGATAEAYAKANANYAAGKKRLEDFLVSMGIARDKAHALVEELAKVTDKKVTVEVKFVKTGDVSAAGVISTGDPRRNARGAYATGTDFAKAGLALVGEQGPELVNFRGGESVYTASQTARMMAGLATGRSGGWNGSGSAPFTVNVTVNGSVVTERQLVEVIESTVSRLGGSATLLGIKAA